ncbi:MAG: efflux RND transporter periplasmic adaptor subunit [Gammaproteobacteria bacterium]|nr:efflux RND transporter periplasmic adaptor subunit [Gammaproteobacteria bacterium]MCW8927710.1 efflux RND transporter periplasmic adaptor subunit [Gammaproteobacteria bacterium]MCW8959782.1 efflux RND transporter periplasmic adaptor subunit [Gammaproteobacteria bacterium]MCW8972009.1 efflux RND transporter periplasmic adaptor subunit [Gammaproteobacteria bacterium]MCW8991950.1 efflux RND transporter periplasmic adaptor subunit [Gammaproteobacteria bacterium]
MATNESEISQTLGLDKPRTGGKKWLLRAALLVALLLIGLLFNPFSSENGGEVSYQTTAVERGDLTIHVSATGTLQPVNQVVVGSELSGTIDAIEVDFNDRVEVGSVLARLDTSTLESRIVEARASLQSAQAKVREAQATEQEKRVSLQRCRELAKRQMCSANDVDAAVAAYERAKAGVASARAQVAIAEAVLDGHRTNLEKATIRSPINGIVLNRKVEPGQTVAASLQTPELFTLAEDLTRMELIVAVDEADIGQIREGMEARFSVDAHPDTSFSATITQIRHAPQTIDGVVTYETVLAVENPDQLLLPGMTATADIRTRRIENALLISNAAFRYSPPVETQDSTQGGGSLMSRMFRPPRRGGGTPAAAQGPQRTVWVLQEEKPQAVEITIGASNGLLTEVLEGALEPGMALITDSLSGGN